jgi:hypothetical protein
MSRVTKAGLRDIPSNSKKIIRESIGIKTSCLYFK